MRYTTEEHFHEETEFEPPYEEVADVHPIEIEDEFPTVDSELFGLTEEEAQQLAEEIEFEELSIPSVELTQEQALALIAELEAEYPDYQDGQGQLAIDGTDVVLELEASPPIIVEFEHLEQLEHLEQSNEIDDESEADKEKERQEKLRQEELEMVRLTRAELQKQIAEIDEELEIIRLRKEKRRKEQAEYLELIVQYEQERKERQDRERLQRQEEIERKRLEREKRLQTAFGLQLQFIEVERPPPPKCSYKSPEEIAREREEVLRDRVPPLPVFDGEEKETMTEMAKDLHERLKGAVGTVFDLQEKMSRTEHELSELRSRLGNYRNHEPYHFPGPGRVIATRPEFQREGFIPMVT